MTFRLSLRRKLVYTFLGGSLLTVVLFSIVIKEIMSAVSSFITVAAPVSKDIRLRNTSGATTLGVFESRNIASPGDQRTLNSRLTLRMVFSPVAFLHFFAVAFKSQCGHFFCFSSSVSPESRRI